LSVLVFFFVAAVRFVFVDDADEEESAEEEEEDDGDDDGECDEEGNVATSVALVVMPVFLVVFTEVDRETEDKEVEGAGGVFLPDIFSFVDLGVVLFAVAADEMGINLVCFFITIFFLTLRLFGAFFLCFFFTNSERLFFIAVVDFDLFEVFLRLLSPFHERWK
jgi:hypothetical protein